MRFPYPRTVRAKLIVTTMIVIAVLLGVVGVVSDLSARRALMSSIDQDLQRRGEDFARMDRRGPMGRGGNMDRRFVRTRDREMGERMFNSMGGPFPGPPPDGLSPGEPPFDGRGANRKGDGQRDLRGPGPVYRGLFVINRGMGTFGLPPGVANAKDDDWVAPKVILLPRPPLALHEKPWDDRGYALATAGQGAFGTVMKDGEPRRVFSTPIRREGQIVAVVQVAYPLSDALNALDNLRNTLVTVAIPLGIVLAGLASLVVVGRLLSPLRRITIGADRIGAAGFGDRLPSHGNDEFAALARTLNGMLGRLEDTYRIEQETARRLEQTVEQQRRFTSDASHELKTPLAVIKANAGLLRGGGGERDEVLESVDAIDEAANRMNRLVRDLLLLARTAAGRPASLLRTCDLPHIVREAIRGVPGSHGNVVLEKPATDVLVEASPEDLSRVFINLIDNALKHSGSSEPVEVRIETEGDEVQIRIADRGNGISPEHLPHLFERFYRTDRSRTSETGGTGLGLAICKGIVEAHGGRIAVESAVDKGTTFTVALPVSKNVDGH
jgi:signal transduction histidine kinase